LTLAFNYWFGGLEVFGYHFFNLGVHACNAVLIGLLLWKMLKAEPLKMEGNGAAWLSFSIAGVWSVHPLCSDAVTYVIQRTELLMATFMLLTLFCLMRASETGRMFWVAAAVAACALGMTCKEVMAAAPILAIFFDRIFLIRRTSDRMPRRPWLYAGLASTWVILILLLRSGPRSQTVGFGFEKLGPKEYLLTQCGVITHYLRLAFWPAPLSIDYHSWPATSGFSDVPLQAALLAALLVLSFWALKKRPAAGFAGLWFFAILAPSSSVVPIASELAAERRMYLPLVAVIALTLAGLYRLVKTTVGRKYQGAAFPAVLAVVLLPCIGATRARNEVFQDEAAVWSDVVSHYPQNALAHSNLGSALGRKGKISDSIYHFSKAIELNPRYAEAYNNLGAALYLAGRTAEAVDKIREALRLKPDYVQAHLNLGLSLHNLGRLEEAAAEYESVLRAEPGDAEAHNHLGAALLSLGRKNEAIGHFEASLKLRPGYPEAAENLTRARQSSGSRLPAGIP
jgi:protein O-mannosyl-transferase